MRWLRRLIKAVIFAILILFIVIIFIIFLGRFRLLSLNRVKLGCRWAILCHILVWNFSCAHSLGRLVIAYGPLRLLIELDTCESTSQRALDIWGVVFFFLLLLDLDKGLLWPVLFILVRFSLPVLFFLPILFPLFLHICKNIAIIHHFNWCHFLLLCIVEWWALLIALRAENIFHFNINIIVVRLWWFFAWYGRLLALKHLRWGHRLGSCLFRRSLGYFG